jgi:hypothetical protein
VKQRLNLFGKMGDGHIIEGDWPFVPRPNEYIFFPDPSDLNRRARYRVKAVSYEYQGNSIEDVRDYIVEVFAERFEPPSIK